VGGLNGRASQEEGEVRCAVIGSNRDKGKNRALTVVSCHMDIILYALIEKYFSKKL
jgi:hypothetical protein